MNLFILLFFNHINDNLVYRVFKKSSFYTNRLSGFNVKFTCVKEHNQILGVGGKDPLPNPRYGHARYVA